MDLMDFTIGGPDGLYNWWTCWTLQLVDLMDFTIGGPDGLYNW